MEQPSTPRSTATVEEMHALAAALQEGEQVRCCVRESLLPRRWTKLRLFAALFALALFVIGAGCAWSNGDLPLREDEWARMNAVDTVFALLSLLFTLVPLLACWALGGFILYCCFAREKAGLCAFTDRRIIQLTAKGVGAEYLLQPDMGYQLCPQGWGRGGSLILSMGAQMLTSPLSPCVGKLPDLREAETLLLSLTRAEAPPEGERVPLSRFVEGASEEESALVQGMLCRGERLLWAERPRPCYFPWGEGARFLIFVMFVSFILGLALCSAGEVEEGALLPASGIAGFLLAVGLCGLLRPLLRRRAMAHTLYLLTDRRALIAEPSLLDGWQLFAYPLDRAPVKRCRQRKDGSGDLISSADAQGQDIDRGFRGFLNVRDLERSWAALAAAVRAGA